MLTVAWLQKNCSSHHCSSSSFQMPHCNWSSYTVHCRYSKKKCQIKAICAYIWSTGSSITSIYLNCLTADLSDVLNAVSAIIRIAAPTIRRMAIAVIDGWRIFLLGYLESIFGIFSDSWFSNLLWIAKSRIRSIFPIY